jgi:uncharacterized protein (TIGR02453 family)
MIKKETFVFVGELIENNDRNWFLAHKSEYEMAKQNIEDFANTIITELKKTDTTIPEEISAKKCVMRIYIDVRFSKDKSPYKNNFGIGISTKGKGGDGAGYYVHIQPHQSFVAGGYWMPQGEHLKAIRQEIDYNTQDLLDILEDKDFKSYFEELDDQEKLKTVPKGYDANHPQIEILKLKSFTVTHSFINNELFHKDSALAVADGLKKMYPLISFLNHAVL